MLRKIAISFLLLTALTHGADGETDDETTPRVSVGPKAPSKVRHGHVLAAAIPRLRPDSENLGQRELDGVPYAAALLPKPTP
jgi:hypothetical protein